MKKFLVILLALVLCLGCFGIVGCGETKTPVVGLICLHGTDSTYDKNFIDAFKAACEAQGLTEDDYVIVTGVDEASECYDEAVKMAEAGVKAIFADSFGHEEWMLQAAEQYPNVQFCHATGTTAHTENKANFHNAFASIYQGRFLAGVAAGVKIAAMIDAGTIASEEGIHVGYVGAHPFAEVKSGYTSWFLGVQQGLMISGKYTAASTIEMDVKFTNSWYDPDAEAAAATALIQSGCVLISQHADSMGAPNACETAGVPNVSYNGSTAADCPNTYIVSSRINWQPYFELMIKSAVKNDGSTIPTDYVGTIANGSVVLTDLGAAAAPGTQDAIDMVIAAFEQGYEVFNVQMFTVDGQHLTSYMADVDTDNDYTPDTEVIKTKEMTVTNPQNPTETATIEITYVSESDPEFRSAPYFALDIDRINLPAAE